MTDITGLWQVNANGSAGTMNITSVNGQGNVAGMITFVDFPTPDVIESVMWDDVAGQIVFVRDLDGSGQTQTYTGFLGDNHADQVLVLAGFFTESDIAPDAPRTKFAWFAQQTQPPPQPSVTITPTDDITVQPGTIHVLRTYTAQTLNLQPDPQFTWSGSPFDLDPRDVVTITTSAQDPSTATFNFTMTGHTGEIGVSDEQTFNVTVQVVDKLGVSASATIPQIIQEFSKGPPN